ncbi:MAG: hypothetical protein LBR15_04885 [Methanobrevibacter sp.]|jgi:fumarate reductase subunit C|nr:hypothetical protein [Candidatus Methanovirga australis]
MVNEERVNCEQSTIILRVLGLVGGISAFTQVFGYLVMMLQMSGTKGFTQIFQNPVIAVVLVLSILSIIAATFYFKNEKIMSVILIMAGIGSIVAMGSPEFSAVLIFVAGFIGLYNFIKARKAKNSLACSEEDF